MGEMGLAYPAEQSVDVALRDGSTIHLRPVLPDDGEAIRAFLASLSDDSLYYRCFGVPNIEWLTRWSLNVDYADRYGVVAIRGAEGVVVGHGAYVRTGGHRAEVAFEVSDAVQGQGIATLILAHLAGVAAGHGITTFIAMVMPGNHKMIDVFSSAGFDVTRRVIDGSVEIELPTTLSEQALLAFARREGIAARTALRSFLAPASVAVVGASRHAGTVGATLVRKLIDGGFAGPIYPVGRHDGLIEGLRCYRSARALPGPVELAVIAVPARDVVQAVRDCSATGARAVVVISAGFAETGTEGAARQRELLRTCREFGVRLIGPNCLGIINTDPNVRLDATFASHAPPPGDVAFLSQSGGLGIALIEAAGRLGLGVSSFVSVGNKADISGNDLLEYWEDDEATRVILLYLESFGNPRRFARVARRVSRSKPILAVKSGRSVAGARATSSHTGALIAASDVTVNALFRQAGVVRTDTIGELLDTAGLLSAQPLPAGNRIAIVTNGGGPGIVCADACEAAGLEVVEIPPQTRTKLVGFLPANASLANPIDMIATAAGTDYRRVIETLITDGVCDAIITLFVPPLMTAAHEVEREIHAAAVGAGAITLASVYMDRELEQRTGERNEVVVPTFAFPEDAVRAIAHAVRYSQWRTRPRGLIREPDPARSAAGRAIIERALERGEGWLAPADVNALLSCYRLPLAQARVVRNVRGAVAAAAEFACPVAIKAIANGLVHKTDVGGVRLAVDGEESVRDAVGQIRHAVRRAGHPLEGLLIQPMSPPGVELLVGVVNDPSFGPVIACGAGGVNAEVLGDVAVRITPLSDLDASEMLRSLRTFRRLEGYRGQLPCDVAAVEAVLLSLSEMVDAHPEVVELDANPVIAGADGATIVDARVRVQRAAAPPPLGALRDG